MLCLFLYCLTSMMIGMMRSAYSLNVGSCFVFTGAFFSSLKAFGSTPCVRRVWHLSASSFAI